jgi:mitochondrial fission protein ELM1
MLHIRPLKTLLFTDNKPGHYQQAEGVLAAIARLRPVETQRVALQRRFWVPARALHRLVNRGVSPRLVLRLGYGIGPRDIAGADLVVSAGGKTLAANAAAAKLLGVPNIFCGTLRRLAPEHVRIAIVNLERLAARPNHLLALPPSPFEAPAARKREPLAFGTLPRRAGLLVGGDSGSVRYGKGDWARLIAFLCDAHQRHGLRWLVTTSRRSSPEVADALAALAERSDGPIERFVDYRVAGPGTLDDILASAQAILVTADSTNMITQAVCAHLPVVGVASEARVMEGREVEYRAFLARSGWYRSLTFSELAPESFLDALAELTPRKTSALDDLAAALVRRLPELLRAARPTCRQAGGGPNTRTALSPPKANEFDMA